MQTKRFLYDLGEKMKISERSDFSILCKIETKNRNLGNLGNVCSTSNSETKCDSIFKTNKNRTETKTKSFPYDLREKKIFPLFLRF